MSNLHLLKKVTSLSAMALLAGLCAGTAQADFAITKPYIGLEVSKINSEKFKNNFGTGYFKKQSNLTPGLFVGTTIFGDWLGVEFGYEHGKNQKRNIVTENGMLVLGSSQYNLRQLFGANIQNVTLNTSFKLKKFSAGLFAQQKLSENFGLKATVGLTKVKLNASVTNNSGKIILVGLDTNILDAKFSKSKTVHFVKLQGDYKLTENLVAQLGFKWTNTSKIKNVASSLTYDNTQYIANIFNAVNPFKVSMKNSSAVSLGLRYEF